MTEYQRITLKESGEEMLVDAMEYPYEQTEVLYIKFIKYNDITLEPEMFITLQPQDILKREYEWTEAGEYELITASEKAIEMGKKRAEMMRAMAEDEMARRAALITTPEAEGGDHEGLFG